MSNSISRSHFLTAAIYLLALVSTLGSPVALAQGQKVLKFIPQADLRILDPITTTAYITRNHGYMIYDTLFATDAKFQVQPQMVDRYELSADKLTYTFTLREGLPESRPRPPGTDDRRRARQSGSASIRPSSGRSRSRRHRPALRAHRRSLRCNVDLGWHNRWQSLGTSPHYPLSSGEPPR